MIIYDAKAGCSLAISPRLFETAISFPYYSSWSSLIFGRLQPLAYYIVLFSAGGFPVEGQLSLIVIMSSPHIWGNSGSYKCVTIVGRLQVFQNSTHGSLISRKWVSYNPL